MSRQKKTKDGNALFWDSALLNAATYELYFNRYKDLYISEGEWKGLPENIDPRYVEICLFFNGKVVGFTDDVLGEKLILPVVPDGPLDLQGNMDRRRAYSQYNGYSMQLDKTNSVVIYNNMLRLPSVQTAALFARRIYELDRIIDVNTRAQKTPVLVKCNEKERLTLINLYKQYDGNQPFIFGDKDLNLEGITSINTGAPYISDKIYELKTQYWNEGLTELGIPNVTYEKKERVIKDEVNRQLGGVIASRNSRKKARDLACEQLSKLWGMKITWDFTQSLDDESYNDNNYLDETLEKEEVE